MPCHKAKIRFCTFRCLRQVKGRGTTLKRRLFTLAATIALSGGLITGAVAAAPTAYAAGQGHLVNSGSQLCLGILGSSTSSGAKAEQGTCAVTGPSPTQAWRVYATVYVGYWAAQLINGVGECLGVAGSSHSSGAQVVQGTCADVAVCSTDPNADACTQLWAPISTVNGSLYQNDPGPGHYGWTNGITSGNCLGVAGSSHKNGALVVQGTCVTPIPSATQQWGGTWI